MSNKFLRNITVVYTQLAYSQTRMLIKTVTSSNTAMNTFTFTSPLTLSVQQITVTNN